MPEMETTNINKIPRNIFVLTMANTSRTFDTFIANTWVKIMIPAMNDNIASKENIPVTLDIIKNQNDNPAETANALNLEDERSILNWINEGY